MTNKAQHDLSGQYKLVFTDDGMWMHAPGSDFLFAYIDNTWSKDVKTHVTTAFQTALTMSTTIKQAVKDTSGEIVVEGLYLADQPSMTKAMNSVPGMGQTEVDQDGKSGSGTATTINQEFFMAILGGLSGNVAPIMGYLNTAMGDVQAVTKQSTVTSTFGTVVGLISVMPVLEVVTTTFQYVFSAAETSSFFVSVNCGSHEEYTYDYKYTVVSYNYAPTKKA